MPADDYIATSGRLKLKGVKDSRVDKKKKKKKTKDKDQDSSELRNKSKERSVSAVPEGSRDVEGEEGSGREREGSVAREKSSERDLGKQLFVGKTEAERRFEERKRRRVSLVFFFRVSKLVLG